MYKWAMNLAGVLAIGLCAGAAGDLSGGCNSTSTDLTSTDSTLAAGATEAAIDPEASDGIAPPPADPLLKALDTNGDEELSGEEIAAASTSLLTLDANADGRLTQDELCPPPPAEDSKDAYEQSE